MAEKESWTLKWGRELSPDIESQVQAMVAECHSDLSGHNIAVLMKPKPWSAGGTTVPGSARPCGPTERLISGYDAVLHIAWSWWESAKPEARDAVLDHLLAHFEVDDDGTLKKVGYDVRVYLSVIERRGAYTEVLQRLQKIAPQMTLVLDADDDADVPAEESEESEAAVAAE